MRAPTDTNRKLFRAHISCVDFEQSMRFIDAANRAKPSSVEWWGVMLAAIICYARPFSPNERRGKAAAADSRLEVDSAMLRGILESASDRKLHRHVVRLRNKAVAHSEARYSSLRLIRTGVNRDTLTDAFGFKFSYWHPVDAQIELSAFRRIAHTFWNYCRFERYALADASACERKRVRRI